MQQQPKTKGATTPSIMTIGRMTLSIMSLFYSYAEHQPFIVMLTIIMLSIVLLCCIIKLCEFLLSVIMPSVIVPRDIMLSV
jgi:hypothetical protein